MRTPLVAANWKMNGSASFASALVSGVRHAVESISGVQVVICPPFTCLGTVHEGLRDSWIEMGGQDVFWMESGAFTGRISPGMLADVGATYCIIGHSECRGRFGKLDVAPSTVGFFADTDETVGLKLRALTAHGLTPILCFGETREERAAGQTDAVVRSQIVNALRGIDGSEMATMAFAYEPVWAIGTGETCDAQEANRVCGLVRSIIRELGGDDAAECRVLYGGSVKGSNADELFGMPEIDGGLIGGASLDANEFARIVFAAHQRVQS